MRILGRIRDSRRLKRLKRKFFRPLSYVEREAEEDMKLLESHGEAEDMLSNLKPEETFDQAMARVEKDNVYARLQLRVPILIYTSGKRLERLTRWLTILTIILAILTALSIVVALHA